MKGNNSLNMVINKISLNQKLISVQSVKLRGTYVYFVRVDALALSEKTLKKRIKSSELIT